MGRLSQNITITPVNSNFKFHTLNAGDKNNLPSEVPRASVAVQSIVGRLPSAIKWRLPTPSPAWGHSGLAQATSGQWAQLGGFWLMCGKPANLKLRSTRSVGFHVDRRRMPFTKSNRRHLTAL